MSALRTALSIDCPGSIGGFARTVISIIRFRRCDRGPWRACGFQEMTLKVVSRDANVSVIAKRFRGDRPIMTTRPQLPDRAPRAKGLPTALDGLLVVDFTRVVAGPACTQTLADFGAEVIKIENPDGGDDTRSYEHADLAGESAAFVRLNRNKRGIALDLTKPVARDIARELLSRADEL